MFDEYCSSLLLNNKETENALNEEQAGLYGGYREFKLDLKQPRTIRKLVPVDLTDIHVVVFEFNFERWWISSAAHL